jgi:micrococcal nuclease
MRVRRWYRRRPRWLQSGAAGLVALFVIAGVSGNPGEDAGTEAAEVTTSRPADDAGAAQTHASTDAAQPAAGGNAARAETATQKSKPKRRRPAGMADRILRVTDGDTVVLVGLGRTRMIGIDTPEVLGIQECFGRQASNFTKRLLRPGTRVRYRSDVERRDRYGRVLVYLWKGSTFAAAELVRRGYAVTLTIAPSVRYAARFRALAARARRADRGLWSPATCNGDDDRPVGGSTGSPPAGSGAPTTGAATASCIIRATPPQFGVTTAE